MPKRSLGWVPFTNQDIAIDIASVLMRGQELHRDLEPKLAQAQRRWCKRQVPTLNAKIANRCKDALHKYSRTVVNEAGAVFVGNVSPQWQIESRRAKVTLDMSWSTLRNLLR